MAVTYLGFNTPVATLDTTAPYTDVPSTVPWTLATTVGDLNVGIAVLKPYTTATNAPAGWTPMGSISSGSVPNVADGGSHTMTLFCKVRSDSEPASAAVSFNGEQNPAFVGGICYRRSAGTDWIVDPAFGADTDTSTTAIAVTFNRTPRFKTGDLGFMFLAQSSDAGTTSNTVLTIPGCTLAGYTSVATPGTSTGLDVRMLLWTFSIASGTATGPPTVTSTANIGATSAVAAVVVRVGEVIGGDVAAAPVDVAVQSPAGMVPLPGKTAEVTVTSPVSTAESSNARTSEVAVTSPAATTSTALRYGDMAASLAVTTTTSGTLRAMEPAAAASEGMTAPVEVQIWKSDNSSMLAVADGRMKMNWLDDMNDSGSGGFDLSRWDPKATTQNMALFNIVRFVYAGRTRFASRIENRQLTVSGGGDHEAQVWQISGRGVLAMLADAALYPEYGIDEFTRKQRSFFYGSKEGAWYVPSEWFQPRGLPLASVPADHPWHGHPADWPDPEAQWLWSTDPNGLANAGPVWFRSKFTMVVPATMTVYASADDQVTLFVDGFPALATVSGEKHSFRRAPTFSIKMDVGEHLIAAEVLNSDASLEEVQPIVTSNEVRPTYANDSNKVYVGKGYTDGGHPYVDGDGSVHTYGTGAAAFDGDTNSFWVSVGNYLGWTSAYEWVEGTFAAQNVTAVRVKVVGGPYTVYVSLKNGGNGWNGDATVPYQARSVNAGTAIRYVREVRVGRDENVTINIPAQQADRIRITLSAEWDSGLWQYRWRGAVADVVVTNESREGSYVRGGNFAGLLVSVCFTDDSGAVTGVAHRSKPEGWLCKTGDRPGWRPAHILTQIVTEAKARNVLGVVPIKLGFTNDVDSYGAPWTMARKDVAYNVGDDYLSIVRKLVEDSELDVWMEPDTLVLHASPKRGEDRTTGPGTVILRPGQSLTDFEVESGRPQATRIIAETEFGWVELANFEPEAAYGRVEGFISLGNALSTDEAKATALNELDRFSLESYDTTVRTTDVVGPRPYIDYDVGDLVLIPTGIGGDAEFDANRVLSFKISEGDAGELDVTIEADRQLDIKDLGI